MPYAYLNPAWPSAGDLSEACRLAAVNGMIGGLALGVVFWRSGGNLVAARGLHALIDLVPATRLVGRLLEGTCLPNWIGVCANDPGLPAGGLCGTLTG